MKHCRGWILNTGTSPTQCQECHPGLFHFYFAIRSFQDFSHGKNVPWGNRTNQKELLRIYKNKTGCPWFCGFPACL